MRIHRKILFKNGGAIICNSINYTIIIIYIWTYFNSTLTGFRCTKMHVDNLICLIERIAQSIISPIFKTIIRDFCTSFNRSFFPTCPFKMMLLKLKIALLTYNRKHLDCNNRIIEIIEANVAISDYYFIMVYLLRETLLVYIVLKNIGNCRRKNDTVIIYADFSIQDFAKMFVLDVQTNNDAF